MPRRADLRNALPRRSRPAVRLRGSGARRRRSSHQAAHGSVNKVYEDADLRLHRRERLEAHERLGETQIRAIKDAVSLADVADLLLAETAPLEALGIDRVWRAGVTRN